MRPVHLALCALAIASPAFRAARADDPPKRGGGLLDGLMPGDPEPGPPARPPRAGPTAAPPTVPDEAAALDQAIDALRARIERQKSAPGDRLPALTAEQADAYVRALRTMREERGRDVSERDRAQGEAVRARAADFETRWRSLAGNVTDDRRPPDLDAAGWSALRDRYFRERSELQADLVELRNRAEEPSRALREIDGRIAAAAALAERVRRMGVASRELAERLDEARVALWERRLADLERLKAERAGGAIRSGSAVAMARAKGDDWYIRTLEWVARVIQLDRPRPPTMDEADVSAPLPAWMDRDAPVRASERQRGRVAWIRSNVEKFERELAGATDALRAADDTALLERREQLEIADRAGDPRLVDPARAATRAEALERMRAELGATRADRLQRERDRLGLEIETWKTHLETETARLGNIEREEAQRRAAPAPAPEVPQPPR